jgi:PAS domain S-box-containing protein
MRLQALHSYAVLDTAPEPAFDRFVDLVARQWNVPMAMISFVDEDRQWIKARIGTTLQQSPRDAAFCHLAIAQDDVLLVHDACADPRFRDNPLVTGAPHVRFYAGAPLITREGHRIGTLCALDTRPRARVSTAQIDLLTQLAALVVEQLQLRAERRHSLCLSNNLALLNDIVALLDGTPDLQAAITVTLSRIVTGTGAILGTLLELRADDAMVHMLTLQTRPGIDPTPFRDIYNALPLPRSRITLGDLFTHDGETMARPCGPAVADHETVLTALRPLGVCGFAAISLHVGERRFVMALGFDRTDADFGHVVELLRQVQRAIRPMLHRKKDAEQLMLLNAGLAMASDAVMITQVRPGAENRHPIIFVNDSFTELTGWAREDVLGRNAKLLRAPETDAAELARVRLRLDQGQPCRTELLNQRRDGTRFWTELAVTPLRDEAGQVTHMVGIQRDITGRRTLEQLEKEQASRLQRLTCDLLTAQRIAQMGSWHWTPATRTVEWSPQMFEIFGVVEGEFEVTAEHIRERVHPEDRQRLAALMTRSMHDAADMTQQLRIIMPDGTLRDCLTQGTCDRDATGEILGITGFWQDITERKLEEQRRRQGEKLHVIGQMTSGIAHDFNNLLTVISLNLEAATDMLPDRDPILDVLAPAFNATVTATNLITRLLSFARQKPVIIETVDVNETLLDIRRLAVRAMGARHGMRFDLAPGLSGCRLDLAQFESAMLNLLVNSRDAMAEGGEIVISTRLTTVAPGQEPRRSGLEAGAYITVSVADTGSGIPKALHEQVFDPFFTTKKPGRGTGLGLSMVAGFARQAGGQVELDSESGRGTTIRLHLPAAPCADPAPSP